jgi:hypothetical protein
MRRTTPTETVILVVVCMAGVSATTIIALYYPDSNGDTYVGLLTVALLIVTGVFMMVRKKAA